MHGFFVSQGTYREGRLPVNKSSESDTLLFEAKVFSSHLSISNPHGSLKNLGFDDTKSNKKTQLNPIFWLVFIWTILAFGKMFLLNFV
ncbi:hypothetical protein ACOSQ3_001414 [Xanthoceras sorbifolium]